VRGHLNVAPRASDVSQGATRARVSLRLACLHTARPPFSSSSNDPRGRDWRVWRSHSAPDARGDHRTVDALHAQASVVFCPCAVDGKCFEILTIVGEANLKIHHTYSSVLNVACADIETLSVDRRYLRRVGDSRAWNASEFKHTAVEPTCTERHGALLFRLDIDKFGNDTLHAYTYQVASTIPAASCWQPRRRG